MEGNNLFLQNIEIKKIRKKLKKKPEMIERNLGDVKPTPSSAESEILADIIVEKNENIVKISPRHTITKAADAIQKTYEDLEAQGISGLFVTDVVESQKYQNTDFHGLTSDDATFELFGFESTPPLTVSSISSTTSQSSCNFLDSKISGQAFRLSKQKEEGDVNIKQSHAELKNKILYDHFINSSDMNFLSKPINVKYVSQKHITPVSQHTDNKIGDSVEDQTSIAEKRHFDDIETDSSEKSKQQNQGDATPLLGGESQIKILKENFERSTISLLNYLVDLENRTLKLEKLRLEKDEWNSKSGADASNSKYREENINLDRGDNISEASFLSASNILKGNSVIGAKEETFGEACLVDLDTSRKEFGKEFVRKESSSFVGKDSSEKNSEKQSSNSGSCSCDCCSGGCLHFRDISRSFNSAMTVQQFVKNKIASSLPSGHDLANNSVYLLDGMKMAQPKKIASSMSNRQKFSNNLNEPKTAIIKRSAATPKMSKQDYLFAGLANFIRKESQSVFNERKERADSSRLVQRPSAPDKLLFQNYKPSPEKSHAIENEKNVEYCRKRNKEPKYIFRGKDQSDELEEDDKSIDSRPIERDPFEILFFVFIFLLAVVTFFIISLFVFV